MKKCTYVLLTLILLLALPMTALAAEEESVTWTLSEDTNTLSYGDQSYTWYPLPPGELLLSSERYAYEVRLPALFDTDQLRVITVPGNEDMVFLCQYTSDLRFVRVYVTEKGAEILGRYRQGEYSDWYLSSTYFRTAARIETSLADALDGLSENAVTENAEILTNLTRYEILGFDETQAVAHVHGAVYLLDGTWFYLNYDRLDSSYFTVTGEFSYRSGTVELLPLDEVLRGRIIGATAHLESRYPSITYEEDESDLEMDTEAANATFLVLSVILGFVFPAVPMTLGLCFAHSGKSASPRRWYLLSGLSVLWMLLAGSILVLIVHS